MSEFKFFCNDCKYGTNLKHVMSQHNGSIRHITKSPAPRSIETKIYKCETCAYSSTNRSNHLLHVLNNHSNKEERKEKFGSMYCESCDVGYLAPKLFKSHLLTKLHKCRANIKSEN